MINKLEYSNELVGIASENAFLDDFVTVKKAIISTVLLDVLILKKSGNSERVVGVEKKKPCLVGEEYGAEVLVLEDLLIPSKLLAGSGFTSYENKGGHILDFGSSIFWTRKAQEFEYSSVNAFMTREDGVVYNHSFIQKMFWKDFVDKGLVSKYSMPFSPGQTTSWAIWWQMIDANGNRWQCVAPNLQKPNTIGRLQHYLINNPRAAYVNVVQGENAGYDEATHTFTIQQGCRMQMTLINSPLGQKEWSEECEMNLDTNVVKFY